LGIGFVDGVIEVDEVFFAKALKEQGPSKMSRKSHRRGKQVKKRGISREQVCIATAMDRQGNIIIELLCKGRMTNKELKKLYSGRIGENPILCTDSHKLSLVRECIISSKPSLKISYFLFGLFFVYITLITLVTIRDIRNLYINLINSVYL
jgi:hypothetical protein